jgi:Uncharacterized conserved protein
LSDTFTFSMRDDHYAISFPHDVRITGNAPFNGGFFLGRRFINRTVRRNYSDDPLIETCKFLNANGYEPEECTVTLTAADVREVVCKSHRSEEFNIHTFITAGVGNAVSLGSTSSTMGTINICVITDLPLTDSAIINAIQTVVEAKSTALFDMDVRDKKTGKLAPGTSTDTVTVINTSKSRDTPYCGRVTPCGMILSKLIYSSLSDILKRPGSWD